MAVYEQDPQTDEEIKSIITDSVDIVPSIVSPVFDTLVQALQDAPHPVALSDYFLSVSLIYMYARLSIGVVASRLEDGDSEEDIQSALNGLSQFIIDGIKQLTTTAIETAKGD